MPRQPPRKMQSSNLPTSLKEKSVQEKTSWEKMFDELYAFRAKSGHCDVSTNDERNKSLGRW
eukprot:15085020-Ditylum_brightwellii.AAC.1